MDYFVAPDGNDINHGSIEHPFKTINKGVEQVQPGDTIFLRGGRHDYSHTISINKSGEDASGITLQAYQDEIPILDFNEQAYGSSNRGIVLKGNYWYLKGFIIQHAGDNGILVYGMYNTLEQLVTRYNGDSGLQLHTGAAYNQILNCDSYLNYDPHNHGENADGFAAKFGLGPGNMFIGCRAWSNSDDGYDTWSENNVGEGVTLMNCWAFWNGENIWDDPSFAGDRNGFKLGHGYGAHILIECVAYDHLKNGIDVNGNLSGVTIYNCTCVGNRGRNFFFDYNEDDGDIPDIHVLRNNLSHLGRVRIDKEMKINEHNSWNGFYIKDTDFRSQDPNGIDGPRAPDGALPKLSFLRLSPTGPLIDAGMDLGLPFEGEAPDLGAFEYIEGDCEGDGDIDYHDLECLTSNWLNVNCDDCQGTDLDGNHRIDLYDFATLADNWRK
jgi:hypothetical protein